MPIRRVSIQGLIPPSESRAYLRQKVADGLQLESPQFTGRVMAALYASEERMPLSGEALIGAELVEGLGVFDIDVRQPPSHRHTLADAPRIARNFQRCVALSRVW